MILALAVMLAMGGIVGGLVTFIESSNRSAINLQATRNRQYAADAAIEQVIRYVQTEPTNRALVGSYCSTSRQFFTPSPATINGYAVRVDCAGAPTPILDSANRVVIERNVLFVACLDTGVPCSDADAIIRAKVNFPTNAAGTVIGSFVQSWSVK